MSTDKNSRSVYRLTKDFEHGGTRVSSGIILVGNFVVNDKGLSIDGSDVFKDIPLDSVEKVTIVKVKKKRAKKKPEKKDVAAKTANESARISNRSDLLK